MSPFSLHSQHSLISTGNTASSSSAAMASWKVVIFSLVFASLVMNSSTSGHRAKRENKKWINENFIKIQDKFDSIDIKMEQLESKGSETVDVHGIIGNITHLIVHLNNENKKKFEKKFKNIEANFKNIEVSLNKSEKCEAKLNTMELIMLELKNASESDDVRGGVTSLCTCADNATTMPVKANSEPTDIRNETKALNECYPNPCLHVGRCLISSTGSKYECECPKFTSGIHCENVECSAEKRCHRFKDTLYVVTESLLTWAEAKVKCEGLNMTLAMPKDYERTLFLRNQLKPIYTKYPYYHLWIGVKRDKGMSKGHWEWVDGSALGEYVGGEEDMKIQTGSYFGRLIAYSDMNQIWDWGSATHQYYSICESRLLAN